MRTWAWVLALVLVGCGEKAVTSEDIWKAAQVQPDACAAPPDSCLGYTPIPPNTLRERLHAPEWTARGTDLVTVVGGLRLTMTESVGERWMLDVVPLGGEPTVAQEPAAPQAPEVRSTAGNGQGVTGQEEAPPVQPERQYTAEEILTCAYRGGCDE
ncbi:hypothetical protein Dgeo_3020 (plasmid) [Deinococcus geothermalis DSM 11300]|uniref:Lipoprotein n=1 Tax=Deinococcus geothermalis (strain DSM 11300 / CIP 105573 / AG-3a) TaxID=319795 RepID=A8ZRF2_DEIGD|nr:hypothetical protein [Deinococcus geothermalis]ABW35061.1 hypothetical protein Dgeo_3020 [Deinococcus geothermalis DSM 11300]